MTCQQTDVGFGRGSDGAAQRLAVLTRVTHPQPSRSRGASNWGACRVARRRQVRAGVGRDIRQLCTHVLSALRAARRARVGGDSALVHLTGWGYLLSARLPALRWWDAILSQALIRTRRLAHAACGAMESPEESLKAGARRFSGVLGAATDVDTAFGPNHGAHNSRPATVRGVTPP
jgi:hypothetical protein